MADYTQLTSRQLNTLLDQYDLGELIKVASLEGGQANSSLKISTQKGVFILSICDEKSAEEIQNLTDILSFLETQGFPTTRLVKAKEDRPFVFHGAKPVYVKQFLSGRVSSALSASMIEQVGKAMARLHQLEPLPGMTSFFSYGLEAFEHLLNYDLDHTYLDWLAAKKSYLEHAIDPDMPKGFIHGDIFWDNIVFDQGSLAGILDFEEACYFYTLFDIGMAVVGCCSSSGNFNTSQIQALLRGYADEHLFTAHEESQLNVFIEYAAISTSVWRFRQYNVKYPNPEKADNYKEMVFLADQIHAMNGQFIL